MSKDSIPNLYFYVQSLGFEYVVHGAWLVSLVEWETRKEKEQKIGNGSESTRDDKKYLKLRPASHSHAFEMQLLFTPSLLSFLFFTPLYYKPNESIPYTRH
jgi:hypothetical protein